MDYSVESMLTLLRNKEYFSIIDENILKQIKTKEGYNLAHVFLECEKLPENSYTYIEVPSPLMKEENQDIVNFFLNNKELFYELPNSTLMPEVALEKVNLLPQESAKPAIFLAPKLIDKLYTQLTSEFNLNDYENEIIKKEAEQIQFKLSFFKNLEFNHEDSLGMPCLMKAFKEKHFNYLRWMLEVNKNFLTQNDKKNKKIIQIIQNEYETLKQNTHLISDGELFEKLLIRLEKERLEQAMEEGERKNKKMKI